MVPGVQFYRIQAAAMSLNLTLKFPKTKITVIKIKPVPYRYRYLLFGDLKILIRTFYGPKFKYNTLPICVSP